MESIGYRAAVHEAVGAADLHRPPLGIDLDAQVGRRQPGLRDTRVPPVAPLVLGAPLHDVGGGRVLVQHVGVVEDEAAQREDEPHRRRGSPGRGTRETTARQLEPHPEAPLPAPHPEQPRHHREQQRPRRPVELEPQPRPEGRAEAAHVRVRPPRTGAVDEQVVLDPEHGGEGDEHVGDERHQVTDVLLVHQHVHHEGEQREEQVLGELKPEQDLQVQPDLEVVIAQHHLSEHPGRRQECHEHDEHETESQELAEERSPFRPRHRVGDLAQSGFPFPPDQLAGEEDDEERDDHPAAQFSRQRGGQFGDDVRGRGDQRDAAGLHLIEHHQDRQERDGGQQGESRPARRDRPERRPRDGERLTRVDGEAERAPDLRDGDRVLAAIAVSAVVGDCACPPKRLARTR